MDSIKNFLENGNSDFVKLYFIERSKNQITKEITYKSLKTIITSDIGQEIIKSTHDQVSSILHSSPEYLEYGITPYSENKHVETIISNNVPYLQILISQISNPNLEAFDGKISSKIVGYIVKIQGNEKTLFLFKKYTPRKLLEKGKKFLIMGTNGFERLNHDIITLDENIDAALLFNNGANFLDSQIFIFNRSKFESFFSFVDFYIEEIENKKQKLLTKIY